MQNNVSFTIILPLPPRVLHPNYVVGSIGGRCAKAAAAKKQRRLACEAVCAAMQADKQSAPFVLVSPSFYCKTNRRRDTDGAITSLKSAYDGIVDAGLVQDDTPEYMKRAEPVFQVDKQYPRLEMRIDLYESKKQCH